MAQINLSDFFRYFNPDLLEHNNAVQMLENAMPVSLLTDHAPWVKEYRSAGAESAPQEKASWPISKAEMGQIMGCSPESLPDSLMDDYAQCCETFGLDRLNQAYFLGQCGHESAGLRYPVEIHDGSNYEYRADIGNTMPGDGVKYAGTGWLQCTGRANHQRFADYLRSIGRPDPKVMDVGKTYTSEVYPWSISGFWWHDNGMVAFCKGNPSINAVGARVNGINPPNGAADRVAYTERAFRVLGL